MYREYAINKPAALKGYPLHRMVVGLVGGAPALFADEGSVLLIRTSKSLSEDFRAISTIEEGKMSAFSLRACISKKRKGKHIYFPLSDWRARHAWLTEQGKLHGFDVLTVHSSSGMTNIDAGTRSFRVDQTDFTGILRVVDQALFDGSLVKGIGSTAKTFGFGMLIIE